MGKKRNPEFISRSRSFQGDHEEGIFRRGILDIVHGKLPWSAPSLKLGTRQLQFHETDYNVPCLLFIEKNFLLYDTDINDLRVEI